MIHQLKVDVSVLDVEVKVNPVPSWAVIDTLPGVPPVVALEKNTFAVALQAVVATVTAPAVIAAEVPTDAFAPVAITILFPAVPKTTFPLVAVIAPRVAVRVVVAVTEPGAVIAEGSERVIVDPEPVEVIWLAVPSTLIFPAVGDKAPPDPPVKVTTPPDVPEPAAIHVALPEAFDPKYQREGVDLLTHTWLKT